MNYKKTILLIITIVLVVIFMTLVNDTDLPHELKSKLYFVFGDLYEYQPSQNKWIRKTNDLGVFRPCYCDLKQETLVYYDFDERSIKRMAFESKSKDVLLNGHKEAEIYYGISFSPCGYIGYTHIKSDDKRYHILDANGEEIFSFSFEVPDRERAVSWSPSSDIMAISNGSQIHLVDIKEKTLTFVIDGRGPRFISSEKMVFFRESEEKAIIYLLNIKSGAIDEICSTNFFRDYDVTSDLTYLVRLVYSVSSVDIVLRDIERGKDVYLPRPPCRKGKGGAVFFDNYR